MKKKILPFLIATAILSHPGCNQKKMRDYQLEVYNDSMVLFSGDKRIGNVPFLDNESLSRLIIKDNE